MSIQLEFERKQNWAIARLSGSSNAMEEIVAHFPQIAEECVRANTRNLLIDFTQVQISASTLDRFEMGQSAVVFVKHGIKIAAVAQPHHMDQERFAELVARNRGVNVRAFTDIQAAEEWLLAS